MKSKFKFNVRLKVFFSDRDFLFGRAQVASLRFVQLLVDLVQVQIYPNNFQRKSTGVVQSAL